MQYHITDERRDVIKIFIRLALLAKNLATASLPVINLYGAVARGAS